MHYCVCMFDSLVAKLQNEKQIFVSKNYITLKIEPAQLTTLILNDEKEAKEIRRILTQKRKNSRC